MGKKFEKDNNGESHLVNSFIIQNEKNSSFEIYLKSCRIKQSEYRSSSNHKRAKRQNISSFSPSSKRRLKFKAINAFPELISQFGLTYHNDLPDSNKLRKHMNTFMTNVRNKYNNINYLWVLEFQKRGAPHYHLYLSLPYDTAGLHEFLATTWNRIVDPESAEHLAFHLREYNLIEWDMGKASYLCKYIDKNYQKEIPEQYQHIGRFWGASQGIVPEPETITFQELDEKYSYEIVNEETGEVVDSFHASSYVKRCLGKWYENQLKDFNFKSSARRRKTNYTFTSGAVVFDQLIRYIEEHVKIPLNSISATHTINQLIKAAQNRNLSG